MRALHAFKRNSARKHRERGQSAEKRFILRHDLGNLHVVSKSCNECTICDDVLQDDETARTQVNGVETDVIAQFDTHNITIQPKIDGTRNDSPKQNV